MMQIPHAHTSPYGYFLIHNLCIEQDFDRKAVPGVPKMPKIHLLLSYKKNTSARDLMHTTQHGRRRHQLNSSTVSTPLLYSYSTSYKYCMKFSFLLPNYYMGVPLKSSDIGRRRISTKKMNKYELKNNIYLYKYICTFTDGNDTVVYCYKYH